MGLLDSIEGLGANAAQGEAGSENGRVMGGLMQALQSHPGGVQGLIQNFQANGLGGHAAAFQNGETPTMTPEQVQQGTGGTGLVVKVAQHTGMSPAAVQMAMATVLPMVMAHFAGGGGNTAGMEQGGVGGMAESMLKKFL